jgi:hypothetical protein
MSRHLLPKSYFWAEAFAKISKCSTVCPAQGILGYTFWALKYPETKIIQIKRNERSAEK